MRVGGKLIRVYLDAVDARCALLSVSAMLVAGWDTDFNRQRPLLKFWDASLVLCRRGGLRILVGEVRHSGQAALDETLAMPVEGSMATKLAEDAQDEVAAPQPVEVAAPARPDLDAVRRCETMRAIAELWCRRA